MDVSSKYLDQESVLAFRRKTILSGSQDENDVITEPVGEDEIVTDTNTQTPHFFYMYTSMIDYFNLWFPFTPFEISMLRTLNVAPCKLSPNSLGYMKAFQLACLGLEIEKPSVAVFFSFFTIKNVSPDSQVYLSSQPNRKRFQLYTSNFKNYKNTFLRVRGRESFRYVMFDENNESLFPFYWTQSPRVIKGTRYECLDEFEKECVAYIETLCVLNVSDLLNVEGHIELLADYMSKFL
jgi:hypothetical protein